jgi:hypothetical protein
VALKFVAQQYQQPDDGGEAMTYSSAASSRIYQQKPAFSKPSHHKPKGWTDSVLGYINEARQWARCLLRNRRLMGRPYTWVVHINLNEEYPPDQISPMWKKVARKLEDRGIVCFWVREPNRLNKLHYHIIVKNEISEADLKKAIEESMPSRKVVKWRKRVEPIKKEWRLCHYVVKAKIKGRNKKGIMAEDLYRDKRLLFLAKLKFRKVGTIGDFWEGGRSKKKMWKEIKAIEKQIGEGLEKPNVKRLCEYVYDFLGGCVPLKHIERSYGYDAEGPAVQDWIESLLAGEWAEEDA